MKIIKEYKLARICFRGIIIGTIQECHEVSKPGIEENKGLFEEELNDMQFRHSIIGSFEDWKSVKGMVNNMAGIKHDLKPQAKASAHDTIMEMIY